MNWHNFAFLLIMTAKEETETKEGGWEGKKNKVET